MGVKYKRNTVSCSDCGGGWNEGCYVKLTRSQIKHVVSQIQPTAQSGSNLMVVGLGSGLESLGLAHTQGPAVGKEGDGSLLQGQKSSGSRQAFGFGAFILSLQYRPWGQV